MHPVPRTMAPAAEEAPPLHMLAAFSSQVLQMFLRYTGEHVNTTRKGMMLCRRTREIDRKLARKVLILDSTFKVLRHLT